MRLPSKVTPFMDSTLSIFPLLLSEIKKGDITSYNIIWKSQE